MKLAVVYNQKSGGKLGKTELRRHFDANKMTVDAWIPINKHLETKLRHYIDRSPRGVIAVVGGDGSMNGVTKVLGGTDAILAPLPGGTLNHFAKDLGVPMEIEEAIARLPQLSARRIDHGRINDIVFCNNAGLGIYPRSLVERETHEPRLGKWAAALWGALVALVRFRSYRLTINGRMVRTPFVFIGNNQYDITAGSIKREQLDRGELCMYVALAHHRWQLALALCNAMVGKTYHLRYYRGKTFHIESRQRILHVSHDGELSDASSPLEVTIEAKALRVLA